jgi:hypothetical protein
MTLHLEAYRPPRIDVVVLGGRVEPRTGDVFVRGRATCDGARTVGLEQITLRQLLPSGAIVSGFADALPRIACDGAAHRWRTLVLGTEAFQPGWARAIVVAGGCDAVRCVRVRVRPVIAIVESS